MSSNVVDQPNTVVKRKIDQSVVDLPKKQRISTENSHLDGDNSNHDVYCWKCHNRNEHDRTVDCCQCPRTFHTACISGVEPTDGWICEICQKISKAESNSKKSFALMHFTGEDIAALLLYALQRMRHNDSEPFQQPVPHDMLPDYFDYIRHPVDLSMLERKIHTNRYKTTDEFVEDANWIWHNSCVYNGVTSKYTNDAKLIVKICEHEMEEFELCSDCYRLSTMKPTPVWFTNPCIPPHCLVWAKLKGFPFWPAKVLRMSPNGTQVDVRFFGEHDRAWISLKDCFLMSRDAPLPPKVSKKRGLDAAIDELHQHIGKLKIRFGTFQYAPFRTELTPEHVQQHDVCTILFPDYRKNGGDSGAMSTTRMINQQQQSNVFELNEVIDRELCGTSTDRNSSIGKKTISHNDDGIGILERLQYTLDSDTMATSPPPPRSANNTNVNVQATHNGEKRHLSKQVRKKQKLDILVQKMTSSQHSLSNDNSSKSVVSNAQTLIDRAANEICSTVRSSLSTLATQLDSIVSRRRDVNNIESKPESSTTIKLKNELEKTKQLHKTSIAELQTIVKESLDEIRQGFQFEKHRIDVEQNESKKCFE